MEGSPSLSKGVESREALAIAPLRCRHATRRKVGAGFVMIRTLFSGGRLEISERRVERGDLPCQCVWIVGRRGARGRRAPA